MIPEGIYKIYQLRHTDTETHRKLAARIYVNGNQIVHLEDHCKFDRIIPEGPITPQTERRFKQLQTNGYYDVKHEGDIAEGHHDDELEQLDIGQIDPDHKFIMTGEGLDQPAVVEMYDDVVTVDGRELDDTEAHQLLAEVAAGRLVFTPV